MGLGPFPLVSQRKPCIRRKQGPVGSTWPRCCPGGSDSRCACLCGAGTAGHYVSQGQGPKEPSPATLWSCRLASALLVWCLPLACEPWLGRPH